MGSKRFVSAIEMGGSGSLSRMHPSEESRYGAPNFVEGTGVDQPPCARWMGTRAFVVEGRKTETEADPLRG